MFNKIYYAIGAGIIALYIGANLVSMITKNTGTPQARSFGAMRMERGKYVYVPPSTSNYPRGGSTGGSTYPSGGGSSYPSGGGYSGGK